jgi:type I restriction enzyme, S subunit
MRDWQQVPAGKIALQRREVVRLEAETEYRTMGVRWYGKGAYDRGTGTTETIKAKVLYRAREGDFTFNRIDTHKGAFDVVPAQLDGALATNEFPLYEVDEQEMDVRFLLLNFQRQEVLQQIGAIRAGSEGRARWKEADFEAWMVPKPPLRTQRRIVEILTAVDDLIAALDQEIEALERISIAISESFLCNEPTVALGTALERIEGGKSPRAENRPPGPEELGVLKVSAVRPFRFSPEESKALLPGTSMPDAAMVQGGDVLITRANTPLRVGYVARVPADVRKGLYLADKTLRLVPSPNLNPDFLVAAMALGAARTHLTSSASGTSASMVNISQDRIRETPIPLPSLDRQREISSAVLSVRANADAVHAEHARLQQARSGLLTGLLDRTIDIEPADLEV